MIPTTDQMDHTTAEERKKLAAMCANCGTWKHFTRKNIIDESGIKDDSPTAGQRCDNCDHDQFISLISQRTFDEDRAKKETVRLLKGKKN